YCKDFEVEDDVEDDLECVLNDLRHAEKKNKKIKSHVKEYEDNIHDEEEKH
ncbi:hypothetical protein KI387_031607, partial [Taxus chinensis]